jgi:hypothetical protein
MISHWATKARSNQQNNPYKVGIHLSTKPMFKNDLTSYMTFLDKLTKQSIEQCLVLVNDPTPGMAELIRV